jgi:hypothetical protein
MNLTVGPTCQQVGERESAGWARPQHPHERERGRARCAAGPAQHKEEEEGGEGVRCCGLGREEGAHGSFSFFPFSFLLPHFYYGILKWFEFKFKYKFVKEKYHHMFNKQTSTQTFQPSHTCTFIS